VDVRIRDEQVVSPLDSDMACVTTLSVSQRGASRARDRAKRGVRERYRDASLLRIRYISL
jgi:hypothetical protein